MEEKKSFIEPLIEKAAAYGKSSYELFKFKTIDKTADIASSAASRAFAVISIFMFVLCFNIGLALWLGELLGKSYYGFFCIAAFYGILGMVFFFILHKWMKLKFSNSIVSKLINDIP
jgi:hypothetical protein